MKNLSIICAFLCISLSMLTACDSDDSDSYAETLSKTYSGPKLKLSLQGTEIPAQKVAFKTADLKSGQLTLLSVMPGEAQTVIDIPEMKQDGTNLYGFSGTTKNDDREVTVSGTVGDTLTVEVNYKVTSPVVGKWKFATKSALALDITPVNPGDTINMHGVLKLGNVVPLVGEGSMSQLISQKSIMLTLIIKMNSELKEDGTLNASLNIPTKDPILLPGIYNVVGDKMYVRLNLLEIVKDFGLFDDEATATRASLMDIFSGIPVDIAVNDNVFSVTLTREMLSPFLNLVPMLLPTIEKAEFPNAMAGTFGITGPNLAGFLGEFQRVVSECPKFNIILSFQPSK